MTPLYDQSGVTLYCGDALAVLRELPSESVHCCITSPPYFGLRDYGTGTWGGGSDECDHKKAVPFKPDLASTLHCNANANQNHAQEPYRDACKKCGAHRTDKQIGLERTWPEYVARLLEVFAEVRRVLRDDGTLWLNLGDSYATGAGAVGECPGGGEQGERWRGAGVADQDPKRSAPRGPMTQANRLPQPDLKPKDLMMIPARVAIALQEADWYLRSDIIWAKPAPMPESVTDRPTRSHEHIFLLAKSERYYYDADAIAEPAGGWNGSSFDDPRDLLLYPNIGRKPRLGAMKANGLLRKSESPLFHGNLPGRSDGGAACNSPDQITRNKRDVWTVNTDPFPEAHFATFPPALILPCVLAGCPVGGVILDPFFGAGTTGLVAKENGRKCIGIELSREYCTIATRRLRQEVFDFQGVAL